MQKLLPLIFVTIFFPDIAHAYIDPNAGSMILQILAPILIVASAGYFFLKKAVHSFFDWLIGLFKRDSS
ncbi:MAG: hypothetical protein HQL69_18735 [Magnetococcales bacterium]|nr:hypothetical protein [Magnetococcales bacterium]